MAVTEFVVGVSGTLANVIESAKGKPTRLHAAIHTANVGQHAIREIREFDEKTLKLAAVSERPPRVHPTAHPPSHSCACR